MPLILLGDDDELFAGCREALQAAGFDLAAASAPHPSEVAILITRAATVDVVAAAGEVPTVERHALARWSRAVVRGITCPVDPRTLYLWGRHVGASCGALRNWCRTAGIPAKVSLDFTRLLRGIVVQRGGSLPLEDLFDVADTRTLRRLLRRAGTAEPPSMRLPASIDEFLSKQRLIGNRDAIEEVRRQLPQPLIVLPGE